MNLNMKIKNNLSKIDNIVCIFVIIQTCNQNERLNMQQMIRYYYQIQMATDRLSTSRKTLEHHSLLKDFYTIEVNFTETPKARKQVEILQSPFFISAKKDLFSELLGTERKDKDIMLLGVSTRKPELQEMDVEEEEFEEEEIQDLNEDQSEADNEEDEEGSMSAQMHNHIEAAKMGFEDLNRGDCNKRRRRKNNIQLKILKHEFDKKQGEWNKNEIVAMADLTGLSEGQVYKWCWDQKKKVGGSHSSLKSVKQPTYNEDMDPNRHLQIERTKFISKKHTPITTLKKRQRARFGL